MTVVANLGRLLMLGIWVVMVFNLIHPVHRPLNIFLNVAFIFTLLMHGLQVAMLKSSLPAKQKKLGFIQEIKIFLFGVFELIIWQKKHPDITREKH